ncbi:small ribosomal subunit protein mL103 (rPPR7) [Typha latifolia]|uniref:small ribosomal subunit protein mL103 (rPPR7) n=1 Tax=Typha latifolia TaxID=4733 RepID=UPI003C2B75B7
MAKPTKISPFHLPSILRLEKNPLLALDLFRNPNPSPSTSRTPRFRYSARSYDLIITKLGKARMFPEMEEVLSQLLLDTRVSPREPLFCHVISFYGRARLADRAHHTFDQIPSFRCPRTIKSFNSLLDAFLQCRNLEAIRSLIRDVDAGEFNPDACTCNILIRAFPDSARFLFDEMRRRGIPPTVTTFGTLIAILCDKSKVHDAFRVKEMMLNSYNMEPNAHVYTTLIKALCNKNELDLALKLKEEMMSDKELGLDSAVYSTLIRAMFRAGRKGEVVDILEEMKKNGVKPDTVAYNAMIAGFCTDEKDFDAAFEVLNEMEKNGCKPDVVSYNIIIAGFCKEGRWREAYDLFDDMPRRECRRDVVSYRTLFEGLCNAREFKEAVLVFDEMLFKGYVPRAESLKKFLEGINGEGDGVSVESTLRRLVEVNALELSMWEKAVGDVLKDSQQGKIAELVDCLILD